ncbi:hypothetical protein MASR2M8_04120 [Opitutaceae bacterium]
MLFISYNHRDTELVSVFVQKLTSSTDRSKIFFDVWSIQPGDGIIDQMNRGLEEMSTFAFFVSKNSLTSDMVSLEWQNALLRSAKGLCKFIPIKLDDAQMPAIIGQIRYIDLFRNGVDFAVSELANTISGKQVDSAKEVYQNVVCRAKRNPDSIHLEFTARTYFEPVCEFSLLLQNSRDQFHVKVLGVPAWIQKDMGYRQLDATTRYFALTVGWVQGLTPGHPFKVMVTALNGAQLRLDYVMHKKTAIDYETIPLEFDA